MSSIAKTVQTTADVALVSADVTLVSVQMTGDVASSIHWDDTSASDIALAVVFAGTAASVIVGAGPCLAAAGFSAGGLTVFSHFICASIS
jgi:hypothetical protein